MQTVKTTVAQLQMRGGMAYVIQLSDGSFIVVDGGEAATESCYQMNKKVLYGYLKQRAVGDTIRIACWIITHFHSDHVDVAMRFMRECQGELIIERFIYDYEPTVEYYPLAMQEHVLSREREWENAMALYPQAERLQPKSGDCLQMGNATLRVLATADDAYPEKPWDPNFNSMVLKISFANGKSFMLLGDAMGERLTALINPSASIYCDEQTLKSDILQTAHHGLCVTENEDEYPDVLKLYQSIAPSIVFWPQNERRFWADKWCRDEKYTYHQFLLNSAGRKNFPQSYTTIVDMADLSITFEKLFDEAD